MYEHDQDKASSHVARMITDYRVEASDESVKLVAAGEAKPSDWMTWEPKFEAVDQPINADMISKADIYAKRCFEQVAMNGAGPVPNTEDGYTSPGAGGGIAPPASSSSRRDILDDRIHTTGYALQRLEDVRRDLRRIGLNHEERVVNEVIEILAITWSCLRRDYRDIS